MNRASITAFVFASLLFGFLYIMFTNKTLVFKTFEVQMETEDYFSGEKKTAPIKSNLGCVLDGRSEEPFNGWMKVLVFFAGLPLMMFFFVRWRINKKIAKALEKQQQGTVDA
ncbi:MAG TPA: hypothetical protein DEP18_07745 [Flavobacteriales bacterium]|nr:hypothetical protein [Flavobacteriales bacterium]